MTVPTPAPLDTKHALVRVTEDDLKWWLALAPTLEWTFAKTYAETAPHSYVVLDRTPGLTEQDYARAGRVIRAFGKPGKFHGHVNVYLEDPASGKKWWFMAESGAGVGANVDYDATLINQADIDQVYGTQDAVDTTSPHRSLYDWAAADYDSLWTKPEDLAENDAVRSLVVRHFGARAPKTLDLGCGTGLTLDLHLTHPSLYTGVDPSQGMLNALVLKHPQATDIHAQTAEEYLFNHKGLDRAYDLVLSTFASPSYMAQWVLRRMPEISRGLTIIMNYDGNWLPDYYTDPAERFEVSARARANRAVARDLAKKYDGRIVQIGNFETLVIER